MESVREEEKGKINGPGDLEGLEGKKITITYSEANTQPRSYDLKVVSVRLDTENKGCIATIRGDDGKNYAVYTDRTSIILK